MSDCILHLPRVYLSHLKKFVCRKKNRASIRFDAEYSEEHCSSRSHSTSFVKNHGFSLIFDDFQDLPWAQCVTHLTCSSPAHVPPTTNIARGSETSEAQACGCHWGITKHPAVLRLWNYANIQIFRILHFFTYKIMDFQSSKLQNYINWTQINEMKRYLCALSHRGPHALRGWF